MYVYRFYINEFIFLLATWIHFFLGSTLDKGSSCLSSAICVEVRNLTLSEHEKFRSLVLTWFTSCIFSKL